MLHLDLMPGPGQSFSLRPPHDITTSKATSGGNFIHLKYILLFLFLHLFFFFWMATLPSCFSLLSFLIYFLPDTKQIGVSCLLSIKERLISMMKENLDVHGIFYEVQEKRE